MAEFDVIAQATFQMDSGLSKDRVENTFHFVGDDTGHTHEEMAWGVAQTLGGFYSSTPTGGLFPLDTFLSRKLGAVGVSRVGKVTLYDFAAAKPRPELLVAHFTMNGASSVAGLPTEVALCLSYFSGRNLARQRGRIYIGPLNVAAITNDEPALPAPNFISVLTNTGNDMAQTPATVMARGVAQMVEVPPVGVVPVAMHWAQHSTKQPVWGDVTNIWVDNEWDTQRRRRQVATARVTLP